MSLIRDLYLIERGAKNKGFDEEQTYQLRQEKSKPTVQKLEAWLKENAIKIPPQSLLGKAFNCTLSQWIRTFQKYLRYLFEKFPYAKTSEDVFNLLPMNISKMDLKK